MIIFRQAAMTLIDINGYVPAASNCATYLHRVEPHPGITGMAPCIAPEWDDIPAKRWRIHPRASRRRRDCCRGKGMNGEIRSEPVG